MADYQSNIRTTITKLAGLVVAMFVFAVWVMPPLYDLFCDIAGLNGKTNGRSDAVVAEIDRSRTVRVQFVAVNNESMPWDFEPHTFSMDVHPGEAVITHFLAENPTKEIMVGQAVPSMAPSNATDYFHKTECFCFNKQVLGPGESAELGLRFIVDQAIPKGVGTITLTYSLFDVTDMSEDDVKSKAESIDTAAQSKKSLQLTAHSQ